MRTLMIAVVLVAVLAPAASAQDGLVLEWTGRPVDTSWPEDGSVWHEFHPTYCTDRVQTGHQDDGNGQIDVCEYIQFDEGWTHIEWVGPTYTLTRMGEPRDEKFIEPIDAMGDGPRDEWFHEVYPTFCNEVHVQQPIEGICQEVYIDYPPEDEGWWHVTDIKLNIRTGPFDSPVEESTWGKIKQFFHDLF